MTYEEFESRVRDGDIPPDLPVRFGAVTGEDFVPVGTLEFYGELVDPGRRQFREQLVRPGLPIITAILVGLQIRIYLASWAPGAEEWLQQEWTNWAPGILEDGQGYRLLTYGFLHIGFTHLLFNLTFLAYTGYNLERALGRLNVLTLYLGSVFCGGVLSMWMAPGRPSLGASGGDFGLIAAAVIFGWKHWEDIPRTARAKFGWALVPYLTFSLMSGLGADNVDNWGHLGGLIGGTVLMTLLGPEMSSRALHRNRWVRRWTLGLCLITGVGLSISGPRLIPLMPHSVGSWTVPVPSYWREGWTFTGDRGWFSPTGHATMVVTRTVHDRPVDASMAVDKLIERIGTAGGEAQVLKRSEVQVADVNGERITTRFSIAGDPMMIRAVVLTRGVVAYRVYLQAKANVFGRYEPILDRAIERAVIAQPKDLSLALERTERHPRSWKPALELGDALYRSGEPEAALQAYERVLDRVPDQTQAVVGRLRVYAQYRLDGGLKIAQQTLESGNNEPRVIVAVAELFDALELQHDADKILIENWEKQPGNGIIRRSMLRRGMTVDGGVGEVF
jgi:rhomboid protease GluP